MIDPSPGNASSTVPEHTLHLVAALFAEEHVLLVWSQTSAHPRLGPAYHALHGRITERCRDVREAWEREHPGARRPLLDATLAAHADALGIDFELSRLKWLVANRRDRTTQETLPGYETHRDTEAQEAEALQALLHDLRRGLC